ncbi:TRAFAC clade GTPase domain-containing protein [Aquisphaera insulae]|uniref:TRAFAC clade GTPase domain-containing protein n=1 Tax=Aquisphaera insulae TaxID=2712864 RepID=UPI0013ED57BE|nr:GTPase domain-containing protein [Aquisphaera insulae]
MPARPYLTEYNRQQSSQGCPLCGGHIYEGEPCAACFLPYKVTESIRSRTTPPRFVVVLGPTGVGKTVYLGMLLDLLSRGATGLRGLSRSPFSLALHRNLILALERQRFPEKTPVETDRWQWIHCEILPAKGRSAVDIVTPDVAGEAVTEEMEDPGSHKTIRALMSCCAGVVILMDLVQVVADGQAQEIFAMQLVSYLEALRPGRKKGRKVDVPVAVVFTKADLLDDGIADPVAFAKGNVPGLYGQCQARLERVTYYASGVAGSSAKVVDDSGRESLVPLRVEPRGIIEPFAWMVGQLDA